MPVEFLPRTPARPWRDAYYLRIFPSFLSGAFYFPGMFSFPEIVFSSQVSGTLFVIEPGTSVVQDLAFFRCPGWWFMQVATAYPWGERYCGLGRRVPPLQHELQPLRDDILDHRGDGILVSRLLVPRERGDPRGQHAGLGQHGRHIHHRPHRDVGHHVLAVHRVAVLRCARHPRAHHPRERSRLRVGVGARLAARRALRPWTTTLRPGGDTSAWGSAGSAKRTSDGGRTSSSTRGMSTPAPLSTSPSRAHGGVASASGTPP